MALPLRGKEKDNKQEKPVVKYLGITEPISTTEPTPQDIRLNTALEKVLREYNLFESAEESRKREEVLGKLNVIVKEWVRQLSVQKGLPEQIASETGAKIFTFGSYRLGVHVSGSDIDTVCVGPRHIDRNDFFTGLYETLLKQKEVTELTTVPDAYVPVMKMKFSGISIDLVFARLALSIIPDDLDILDENNLKNLDEKSMLSLNGCRVTDQILRLVPNIPNFRMTLRCMKFWGQRRGVYSNVVGFLGGISWALLTARICQLYPNALPSTLVSRFFRIYEQWKWPNPILLTHTQDANLGHKVWNPKLYPKDKFHLMPIITPAYPAMNSTYNVSESTLKLLKEEFARGADLTFKIENNMCSWNSIFEKCDFFSRYKVYLQVDIVAQTEPEHRKWEGFVESRLRFLIQKLEVTPYVMHAHPYPKIFNNPQAPPGFPYCSSFFMGLTFNLPAKEAKNRSVDLTPAVGDFTFTVKEWPGRTPGMEVRVHYLKKANLPSFVLEEFGSSSLPGGDSAVPTASPTPPLSSRKRESSGKSDGEKQLKKLKPETPPTPKSQTPSPSLTPNGVTANGTIPPLSLLNGSPPHSSEATTANSPLFNSVKEPTTETSPFIPVSTDSNTIPTPSTPLSPPSPTTPPPTTPPAATVLVSPPPTSTEAGDLSFVDSDPSSVSPAPSVNSLVPPVATTFPGPTTPPPSITSPSIALTNDIDHVAITDYELGELGIVGELGAAVPNAMAGGVPTPASVSIPRPNIRTPNQSKKSLSVNLLRQGIS